MVHGFVFTHHIDRHTPLPYWYPEGAHSDISMAFADPIGATVPVLLVHGGELYVLL